MKSNLRWLLFLPCVPWPAQSPWRGYSGSTARTRGSETTLLSSLLCLFSPLPPLMLPFPSFCCLVLAPCLRLSAPKGLKSQKAAGLGAGAVPGRWWQLLGQQWVTQAVSHMWSRMGGRAPGALQQGSEDTAQHSSKLPGKTCLWFSQKTRSVCPNCRGLRCASSVCALQGTIPTSVFYSLHTPRAQSGCRCVLMQP